MHDLCGALNSSHRIQGAQVRLDLMSDGSEFQVCGASVEIARLANSVLVRKNTRQMTAEAKQEQLAGSGRSGMRASKTRALFTYYLPIYPPTYIHTYTNTCTYGITGR